MSAQHDVRGIVLGAKLNMLQLVCPIVLARPLLIQCLQWLPYRDDGNSDWPSLHFQQPRVPVVLVSRFHGQIGARGAFFGRQVQTALLSGIVGVAIGLAGNPSTPRAEQVQPAQATPKLRSQRSENIGVFVF